VAAALRNPPVRFQTVTSHQFGTDKSHISPRKVVAIDGKSPNWF
jgi:hypothetical protein